MDFCNLEGPLSPACAVCCAVLVTTLVFAGHAFTHNHTHSLHTHKHTHKTHTQPQGDNDPVDVVEIGSTQLKMGGVYKVRARRPVFP